MLAILNLVLKVIPLLAGLADRLVQAWQRAQDRQAGRNEQRLEEAEHAVANAERITAARDAAPDTVGELRDRIERGGRL